MKRNTIIAFLALELCLAASARAATAIISNVRAAQRPGTKLVDIRYDVTGTTNDVLQVRVAASTNGGLSYTLPATSCSGPGFGASVVPGSNRLIVWDAGVDWPSNHSANVSFRVTVSNNSVPSGMAFIPAGPFQMGDALNDWPRQWPWPNPEIPVHTVHVSAFFMDQFEVTKASWDEVHDWATNHGYAFDYEDLGVPVAQGKAPDHPAYSMTWFSAVKWCNARSEKEGLAPAYYTSEAHSTAYRTGEVYVLNAWVKWNAGYRLPTEAEWEKAARGGATGRRFSWSDTDTITHSQANYFSDTNYLDFAVGYDVSPTRGNHPDGLIGDWPYTTPVGHFAPNGFGLYDMTGNVWEMCWDWGYALPYGSLPQFDPHGPDPAYATGYAHALRGGSWSGDAGYSGAFTCRVAYRSVRSGAQEIANGFRCVLPGGQPSSSVTTVDTRDIPVTVSGRIRSAQTGLALAGVSVTLGGQTVTTGADGSYSLPNVNLTAGNTLSVASGGFARSSQTPPLGAGSVAAALPDLFLKAAAVTNRPVVTDLVAQYDGIFLSGASFQNSYAALVDWNGFTPGHVDFYVNDTNSTPIPSVETTAISGWANIEMSQGFFGSYTPGANKIWAVAVDASGLTSDPYVRYVTVIPPPDGLNLMPIEWNPLYGDSWWYDPSTLHFKVPMPPKNLLGGFDMAMPLLETLGLHLDGEYKLTYAVSSGEWQIGPDGSFLGQRRMESPYLDWGLWGPHFWANAWASGFAGETSGFELDQVRMQMGLEGKALIFRIHFTDWLPPGPALNQVLDAFEMIGVDINKAQRIDIYGLFGLGADLTWSCREKRFSEAILTPSGGVMATYGIDLYAASLETYVSGVLAFPIRVTSPQAWKVTGEIAFGLSVYVWQLVDKDWNWILLQGEIASSGNWGSQQPTRLAMLAKDGLPVVLSGVLVATSNTYPRPMSREYLDAGPAQFLALDSPAMALAAPTAAAPLDSFRQISQAPVKGSVAAKPASQRKGDGPAQGPQLDGPQAEANQVDLTLLQNAFPFSQPAIASWGQELMLLYVADNGSSNSLQFTDIEWTRWDGTNWSAPQAIRTNTQAEFTPQVKYDGNGDAVAVWQRVADLNFTNVNVTALAAQMEIVWSRWIRTNGVWSEPAALTTNDHLDNTPLLCGPMGNGNVLLVWTENGANLLMGTNGPGADTVRWCEWSAASRSWSAPQTLVDGLAYRLSQSLAGASNTAVYAWSQDGDGVLTNATDHEVFYVTYTNGAWRSPIQFTPDGTANSNVRAAVAAAGNTYLFWENDLGLVMSRDFSSAYRLVRRPDQTSGFADYVLTVGPAGNLVLLWQGMSTNGSDAHYAVYDPVSDTWSRDGFLCQDAPLERSFAPAWDNVGNLTVAYDKQQIFYTNKTVTLTDGSQITLTNVPQRGRVDVMVTKRALVKDLALGAGDLTVGGVNYLPGDPLTLTAIVRNLGNIAVSNVVVGFYKGDPDSGGVLLTNVTLPGWLEAAATNLASAVWVVPEPAAPNILYAVVNRASLASEFNESNNVQSVSVGGTDLTVSLVSYRAETNGAVRVIAKVQNLGAPAAANSVLAIRREGQTDAPLATATVPLLEPGRLAQVALDLPAGTQPEGQAIYRLFADDTHAVADVNTNNNSTTLAVSLYLDADGDGIPDGWMMQHFGHATGLANDHSRAQDDYDGDGMSNLAEYLAGTDPKDTQSYLRLTSIFPGGASGVQITWGSASSKLYSIQRASALVPGGDSFTNLVEHVLSTPPENSYLDTSARDSASFFYRIRVE
jgi:formylglycine-generating enzyme